MTPTEMKFVNWIKEQCKSHGVKCSLRNVRYLRLSGNIKCSGYFEGGDSPKLVVSMNRKDWVEILAHEYCHLTQWAEGISLWNQADTSLVKMDEWLSGNEVKNIEKHLGVARDLELDNEKRSVKLIQQWGLDVDIDQYIRKANAYVQFYNYMGITRRWSNPKNSPYGNPNVVSQMSTKFNMRYKKLSKKVKSLFSTHGI